MVKHSLSLVEPPHSIPGVNPEAVETDRHPHTLFTSGPFSHT